VDSIAKLCPEHVVHELVLRDPAQPRKCRRADDSLEMVTVTRNFRTGTGDSGLNPALQFFWGCRHSHKRSGSGTVAILNEAMITLTDKGAEKVREFLSAQAAVADTAGLRVGVRGGGCSGFQYALAFDEQRDGDTVFEDKGIRLLVDRPSLPYVTGSVIDFVDGLQGAGFKVDNPNVIAACGCGSSFRVADEEQVSAV
jgi:iron-sulfur cluster assembly protein